MMKQLTDLIEMKTVIGHVLQSIPLLDVEPEAQQSSNADR
jgi:hypothetical protein